MKNKSIPLLIAVLNVIVLISVGIKLVLCNSIEENQLAGLSLLFGGISKGMDVISLYKLGYYD